MSGEYREETLRQALQNLADLMPEIRSAVVVNVDGLVIAAYPARGDDVHDPQSDQSVAATTALIMGLAERTLERLAQGSLERILVEGAQGAVGVYPCTRDAVLAVLIDKKAKMGRALTATARAAHNIQTILDD
jgi:predicted regulator of Ras-like GTPase activity (Roadblock/LC7/MglB family)